MSEPKIKIAVLLTGNEVIYIDNVVSIEEPAFCIAQPGPTPDQVKIGFAPMAKYSEAGNMSPLNGNLVLMTYDAEGEIASVYMQYVQSIRAGRSGIVIPPKGIKIVGK